MSNDHAKDSVNQEGKMEEEGTAISIHRPSSTTHQLLPKSVRGAPEELRYAIRKKQNKEVNDKDELESSNNGCFNKPFESQMFYVQHCSFFRST